MKKSLGQNFLIDQNVIRKIVNIIDIKKKILLKLVLVEVQLQMK